MEMQSLGLMHGGYLTNRMQVTDVGEFFSDPRVVPCGVPQGSIMGPLLF